MSFFYLHKLEALTMRNVVFLTVQIYIQFQFRYINHSQKTVQKSKISHEIRNQLREKLRVTKTKKNLH